MAAALLAIFIATWKATLTILGADNSDGVEHVALPCSTGPPASGKPTFVSKLRDKLRDSFGATRAIETLEQLAHTRRERCLEVLRKPIEERTAEELELLREWAAKITFRDAAVQRLIDPMMLCKAMTCQAPTPDEIIISQGEAGDAFYAVFAGAASVYVAYDVDEGKAPTSKPVTWPAAVVRDVDRRLRRLRRLERGESLTPEAPHRSVAAANRAARRGAG